MEERRPSPPGIERPGSDGVAGKEPTASAAGLPRGFTLIEIMVVMVIIGIIAAMSIVSLADALDRSRQRATVGDMRALAQAIESYAVDNNDPPASSGSISALLQTLEVYSGSLPGTDHWGNDYQYTRDARGNYTLQSRGKDGVDGEDISPATAHDYHLDIVINNGIFVATPD